MILLLCCKGFPHIGKLANGYSYLKSPYNAILSLEMHESFRDITLATNTKLVAKKVLEIFFFTDFMHCVLF